MGTPVKSTVRQSTSAEVAQYLRSIILEHFNTWESNLRTVGYSSDTDSNALLVSANKGTFAITVTRVPIRES
jgi:hypothetical protein